MPSFEQSSDMYEANFLGGECLAELEVEIGERAGALFDMQNRCGCGLTLKLCAEAS